MTSVSHQTVRLSQGKHRGPDHGACVMELSSMLAGEAFSDRPRCVDPVIAGFLRTYNDGIDDTAGTLAGRIAVKQASRRRPEGAHEAALAFVRELIAVGTPAGTARADRE